MGGFAITYFPDIKGDLHNPAYRYKYCIDNNTLFALDHINLLLTFVGQVLFLTR